MAILSIVPPAAAQAPGGTAAAERQIGSDLLIATDLAADGAWAVRAKQPILLYFERRECPYCVRAQRYLEGVAKSHRDRARFRRIETDRTDLPLTDFAGERTNHAAFARALKGTLTPTVVVVAGDGTPLAPPLVGLPDESFYSYYLEELLETAEAKLQKGEAAR